MPPGNLRDISVATLAQGYRSSGLVACVEAAATAADWHAEDDRREAFERLTALPPRSAPSIRSEAIHEHSLTSAEAHEFDRLRSAYRYSFDEALRMVLDTRRRSAPNGGGC